MQYSVAGYCHCCWCCFFSFACIRMVDVIFPPCRAGALRESRIVCVFLLHSWKSHSYGSVVLWDSKKCRIACVSLIRDLHLFFIHVLFSFLFNFWRIWIFFPSIHVFHSAELQLTLLFNIYFVWWTGIAHRAKSDGIIIVSDWVRQNLQSH